MKYRQRIAVVGGGVAGLMLVARLANSRQAAAYDITLIDGAPRPAFAAEADVALRVSAIATGSAQLFAEVGAWSTVAAARLSPYESMRVWDHNEPPEGPATLGFDAAEFAVPQLGFIVENVLLQHALLEVLDELGVTMRFETPIRALRRSGQRFVLDLGARDAVEADLVVAADGARSFLRNAAGIETRRWPYDQTAFVTHLETELPHRQTAWQRFTAEGPLGILPLADGRVSVACWFQESPTTRMKPRFR